MGRSEEKTAKPESLRLTKIEILKGFNLNNPQ